MADQVVGRSGETTLETILMAVYDWLALGVRRQADRSPRSIAPLAEAWDKIAVRARDAEAFNLDKRPIIMSTFVDLAAAVRASSARH